MFLPPLILNCQQLRGHTQPHPSRLDTITGNGSDTININISKCLLRLCEASKLKGTMS